MPFGLQNLGFNNPLQAIAGIQVRINRKGLFVYSGAPGVGNLIYSITTDATDTFGNPTTPTATSYDNVAHNLFAIDAAGAQIGSIANPTWRATMTAVAGLLHLQTPLTSGLDVAAQMNGHSSLETGDGVQRWEFLDAIMADAGIYAPDPANNANREIFHSVSATVGYVNGWLDSGVAGRSALKYRLTALPNEMEWAGSLKVPVGFAAGQAITNAFPAAYQPNTNRPGLAYNLGPGVPNQPVRLNFSPAGVLTFGGPVANVNAGDALDVVWINGALSV